jgi:hypothetical protein
MEFVGAIDGRDQRTSVEDIDHARRAFQSRRYVLFVLRSPGPRIVPK